tara:strand:+ start:49 stop:813 length:765 start_codon:yes stop_codon:yes gene_type:complete
MAEKKAETKVESQRDDSNEPKEVKEEKAEAPKEEKKEEKEEPKNENAKKEESKPAVAKPAGKGKVVEAKVVLEREYIVPLRKGFLKVPRYKRAKKAIRVLREFIAKHMKVEDRDLRKVKVDRFLNEELWFRGIKKPAGKIKVKAIKDSEGVVRVELAEVPEVVKFKMAREEKLKVAMAGKGKKKAVKTGDKKDEEKDKDGDGVADKVEEKEDVKAGAEKAAKVEKAVAKEVKHTAKAKTGKQEKQQIHRKAMKR